MSILDLFRSKEKPDLDQSVLVQLRKAGSDLSKPHNMEFFLYFPTRSVAEKAAPPIRDAGFEVEVRGKESCTGGYVALLRHENDGSRVVRPSEDSPKLCHSRSFNERRI